MADRLIFIDPLILADLRAGEKCFADVAADLGRGEAQVAVCLRQAREKGYVVQTNPRTEQAVYALTDQGRAWLAEVLVETVEVIEDEVTVTEESLVPAMRNEPRAGQPWKTRTELVGGPGTFAEHLGAPAPKPELPEAT